jgi:hypothetical protein
MGHVISRADGRRILVEGFIKARYAEEHGALVESFPQRLLCRFDAQGRVICAAGIRDSHEGFFSEAYFDEPVEDLLRAATSDPVGRHSVFEVTSLASRSPIDTPDFIGQIVNFGFSQNYSWSFFTVTRRLALLLRRMGLQPVFLAKANPARIPDPGRWGDYYVGEPRVLAVSSVSVRAFLDRREAA